MTTQKKRVGTTKPPGVGRFMWIRPLAAAIFLCFQVIALFGWIACSADKPTSEGRDILIENGEMRLTLSPGGEAKSLIHKPSGQECLIQNENIPAFTVTLNFPYNNELQLRSIAKTTVHAADSVSRDGQYLHIFFSALHLVVNLRVDIAQDYIAFTYEGFEFRFPQFGDQRRHPIDAITVLQLPVADRANFGEWLNVVWDDQVAVNLLATNPHTRIDAVREKGYRILSGERVSEIGGKEAGVALITTTSDRLLDRIDRLEHDFNLPLGVQSRRQKEFSYSYFLLSDVNPGNVDEYLKFARQAGFRAIQVYYYSFVRTMGHYSWNSGYPRGMVDLQEVIQKIREAGMIPGLHFHYSKAQKEDLYVSPVPDHRLNLLRIFTLSGALDDTSSLVQVEENPSECTLDDGRRILKIGSELVEYEGFTDTRPYAFTGCKRGVLNTRPAHHEKGVKGGLLDIDNWPIFVRFDQRTTIQQEVAERLGSLYNQAGFRFGYYDGAEDVQAPFWYNVSKAQLQVHNCLNPAPLFSEGAFKSHFSWHILTRGNAFDTFAPEYIKEAVKINQLPAAAEMAQSFTPVNFGWIKDELPGENSIGLQPDMVEYVCSRAAAWDCPISLKGDLQRLRSHPRVNDNLEVIRRWEEVRLGKQITQEQKTALKNPEQEYFLLRNQKGGYEMLPYSQIMHAAGGNPDARAFLYQREGKSGVVFWHTSGEGQLELSLNTGHMHLYEEGYKEIPLEENGKKVILPLGSRKYFETRLSPEDLIKAFQDGRIR